MKVGDKVTCIDSRGTGRLRLGGEYIVGEFIGNDKIAVIGDPGMYFSKRFYLAVQKETPVTKDSNPKEAIGAVKLNFSLVPSTLSAYACQAFSEGAYKYGAYNWRVAGVRASTYYSAFQRHVNKWWNGEDLDPKTKVHHLGNAIACLGIILDAKECGKLNDDRPPKMDFNSLIERSEEVTAHLREMSKGLAPHNHTALDPVPAAP